jgi:hypothetical protein
MNFTERLRELMTDIRAMEWGKKQAWIVHGPPDKETGIAAAKEMKGKLTTGDQPWR